MGLDIWFRADIVRLLRATHEAMSATATAPGVTDNDMLAAYRQGFRAALCAVAAGFGLDAPSGGSADDRTRRILQSGSTVHGGWPGKALADAPWLGTAFCPEVIDGESVSVGRDRPVEW